MNEVLRLLDRVLKRSGYAIKKHPQLNLLPLADFKGHEDVANTYKLLNSNSKNKSTDNVSSVEICLRTCMNEKRAASKRSELTGVNLEEHLLGCIRSLMASINKAITQGAKIKLTIFDDRSTKTALDKLNALCNTLTCPWEIRTTKTTGQGESMHEHFSYARDKDALFYFCEDDYLYETNAIHEMIVFYQTIYMRTGSHLLIHPQEHELIYSQFNYPSYILKGKHRRWRTISHSTHTFFTHSKIVNSYWECFENTRFMGTKKRQLGSEKKTTNKLFNYIPGFSPIPAVAIHFQTEQCLPPFYNWKNLWEQNKLD